jgi:SAM-dependent methyltransferase
MNLVHRCLCRSTSWRRVLRDYVVPWVLSDAQFGSHLLELGPGHGLTTDLLRPHVAHLTALEIDPVLANSLAARFSGTNVTVVRGDATAMPFPRAQFSAAVSLHMLHHIHDADLQNQLFRELCRVLNPGAIFVGVDSIGLNNFWMRVTHNRRHARSRGPRQPWVPPGVGRLSKHFGQDKPVCLRFHAQRPAAGL